jgi:pimeloyl-ACP methyl ester carboxylesterase
VRVFWKAADGNRRLRTVGGLIAGVGVLALTVGQFAAMHLRGTDQGLTGAMHLVEGMAAMLMVFTSMGIAATAFGARFRFYTIATIVLSLAFGAWSLADASLINQGLATPWVGVKERIFWYAYQSWYIVLAIALLMRDRETIGCAATGYLRLGGVDQWVMIRGENLANPPLILLHGGPGFSETALFRHFNAALEKTFTLVYWDQRGAGKSFSRRIPRSSMTVEQFIADLDQLVDAVCARLRQEEGRDLRTFLGLCARRALRRALPGEGGGLRRQRPDRRLGGGRGGLLRLRTCRSAAPQQREGAARAARQRAAAVYTRRVVDGADMAAALRGADDAEGAVEDRADRVWEKESSILDLPGVIRGFRFSLDAMWTEVSKLNLLTLAPVLRMPVFFFLGRRDHWVPPEMSVAYFDMLTAPSKRLVWFERSGHEPFVDEPDKFNREMVDLVRPVVGNLDLQDRARSA